MLGFALRYGYAVDLLCRHEYFALTLDPHGLRQYGLDKQKVSAVFRFRTASLSAPDTLISQTKLRLRAMSRLAVPAARQLAKALRARR